MLLSREPLAAGEPVRTDHISVRKWLDFRISQNRNEVRIKNTQKKSNNPVLLSAYATKERSRTERIGTLGSLSAE